MQDLKIQRDFLKTKMLHKKIKNSNYKELYEKTAFEFNFGPQEVPQPENA